MGDKITSVAELKRAVKARRNPYQRDDAIGTGNFELLKCLELIGEFEAGIREPILETIELLDNLLGAVECESSGHKWLEKCVEEVTKKLRRLLGNEESLKDYLARVEKSRLEKMGEGGGEG